MISAHLWSAPVSSLVPSSSREQADCCGVHLSHQPPEKPQRHSGFKSASAAKIIITFSSWSPLLSLEMSAASSLVCANESSSRYFNMLLHRRFLIVSTAMAKERHWSLASFDTALIVTYRHKLDEESVCGQRPLYLGNYIGKERDEDASKRTTRFGRYRGLERSMSAHNRLHLASPRDIYLSGIRKQSKSSRLGCIIFRIGSDSGIILFQWGLAPSVKSFIHILFSSQLGYIHHPWEVFLDQIRPVSTLSHKGCSFSIAIHPLLHLFKKVHGLSERSRGLFAHHSLLMSFWFVEPGV